MCKELRKSTIASDSKTYAVLLSHQRLSKNIHLSLRLITLSPLVFKLSHFFISIWPTTPPEEWFSRHLWKVLKGSVYSRKAKIHCIIWHTPLDPRRLKERCQICQQKLQWRNRWLTSSSTSQRAHLLQRVVPLFWRLSSVTFSICQYPGKAFNFVRSFILPNRLPWLRC